MAKNHVQDIQTLAAANFQKISRINFNSITLICYSPVFRQAGHRGHRPLSHFINALHFLSYGWWKRRETIYRNFVIFHLSKKITGHSGQKYFQLESCPFVVKSCKLRNPIPSPPLPPSAPIKCTYVSWSFNFNNFHRKFGELTMELSEHLRHHSSSYTVSVFDVHRKLQHKCTYLLEAR